MSKTFRSACSLDCFDACAILVTVENGQVVDIKGDPDHPVTKGYICKKGRAHMERLYSPKRLRYPLKKVNGKFVEITWEEAIDSIIENLENTLAMCGSQGVLHYSDCGYAGISKSVDEMFFNCLGGVSSQSSGGSLCWRAGMAAQKYDFGDVRGHGADDIATTNCLIIWGRNPAVTNIHIMQGIQKVKRNGGTIICIDPIQTKTAKMSDWHLPIRPGSDGALAFAMARIILENGWEDSGFIESHTVGFEDYRKAVMNLDMDCIEAVTGLSIEDIKRLTEAYVHSKPASILLGYGMQRYVNGAQNVRAIDALGALTGQIGIAGGGVTYANKSITKYVAGYVEATEKLAQNKRPYMATELASFIKDAVEPKVDFAWIAKANPVIQVPDTEGIIRALQSVKFVVVVDMFMTDTAKQADLVLPATSILEEEDFIYSSMYSPALNYAQKCVEPPEGIIGEYDLFKILASRMSIKNFPIVERETFFKEAFKPLIETFNVSYEQLKKQPFVISKNDVPWADRRFETSSGKFEFVSERAKNDGFDAGIRYVEPTKETQAFPFRLITPHDVRSTNSQHFIDIEGMPAVTISSKDAKAFVLESGMHVLVKSKQGKLHALLRIDDKMPSGVAVMMQGYWKKQGSVNTLIVPKVCKMGEQAAYYDTFVQIIRSDGNINNNA